MRYESLSPVLNKKDKDGNELPNMIKVSNTSYHKDDTPEGEKVPVLEIEFKADRMSYPQFDALDEFIADCGSDKRALEVINDVTSRYATTAGKASIRNATSGQEDEIISAGCNVSRSFSWKEEAKLSAKDKAGLLDQLVAIAPTLNPEEFARRFAELTSK